jgi:wyosine [tRNA(Phe)-imidazoG37] synthetase (radical SAM superfamily)
MRLRAAWRYQATIGIAGSACDVDPDVLYCPNRGCLDGRCEMRTLYGPIDSWRFGRSLGVDPLAGKEKRCPFSCTYCQYGETPHPTWRRQPFVAVDRLEADLDLLGAVPADCVTFAGLGEPTLATNLPDLVAAVRRRFQQPVIVLTNSALIPDGNVRRDLLCFDAVVAKLDAPDAALFQQINRPGGGFPYSLAAIVEGIRRFRRMYGGRLVLQMMFVQASRHAAPQMARLARSLEPDEVQLDTPLQPALGGPLSRAEMQAIEVAFAGLPVRSVYARDGVQVKPRFM